MKDHSIEKLPPIVIPLTVEQKMLAALERIEALLKARWEPVKPVGPIHDDFNPKPVGIPHADQNVNINTKTGDITEVNSTKISGKGTNNKSPRYPYKND